LIRPVLYQIDCLGNDPQLAVCPMGLTKKELRPLFGELRFEYIVILGDSNSSLVKQDRVILIIKLY